MNKPLDHVDRLFHNVDTGDLNKRELAEAAQMKADLIRGFRGDAEKAHDQLRFQFTRLMQQVTEANRQAAIRAVDKSHPISSSERYVGSKTGKYLTRVWRFLVDKWNQIGMLEAEEVAA